MIWWLTLAVALLGPVVLLYTGLSMVRRLERLERAVRRVRVSQGEAQTLQVALVRLQERLTAMRQTLPALPRRSAAKPPPAEVPRDHETGVPRGRELAGHAGATAGPDGRNRGDRHGWFGPIER